MSQKQRGFTLIELMVTLALLAIIAGLAAPSFEALMRNSRATSVTNELVGALQFARSQAIHRNAPVRMCPANSGLQSCAGSTDFSNGWIVANRTITDTANDIYRQFAPSTRLTSSTITSSFQWVEFQPRGGIRANVSADPQGSNPACTDSTLRPGFRFAIDICDGCSASDKARYLRYVTVTPSGSVITQRCQK